MIDSTPVQHEERRDGTPTPGASAGPLTPTIRIRGLNHHFGEGEMRKQVLYDNELDLMPGEIVIMTGPSGSGKTTLLTLIGALRSVQEGSVRVLGRELGGLSRAELVTVRREIGFIFQAHNLFDSLTALQNVRLAAELHPLPEAVVLGRATEVLVQLGLEHRIHAKPQALSVGQRQRVAIARALVNRPKLILADEPTAALDKASGRDVLDLLQALTQEERCTILMVTHDNRILDAADRIVNMVDGRIISDVAVREAVTVCELLAHCPVLSTMGPTVLSEIAVKMARAEYPAGAVVLRQGDVADRLFLIQEGTAAEVDGDGDPDRAPRTLGPGESFGAEDLISGQPCRATIVARTPLSLFSLDQADFRAAIEARALSFKDQLLKAYFQRQ